MKTVKINVQELSTALRQNRDKHRAVFERALEGFRRVVIDELEGRLSDARKGKDIVLHIALEQPVDQTRDYDRAIMMCKMSAEGVVELTEREFASYVMDDWSWKKDWLLTNSTYMDV